jgi:hypothetical protein
VLMAATARGSAAHGCLSPESSYLRPLTAHPLLVMLKVNREHLKDQRCMECTHPLLQIDKHSIN